MKHNRLKETVFIRHLSGMKLRVGQLGGVSTKSILRTKSFTKKKRTDKAAKRP